MANEISPLQGSSYQLGMALHELLANSPALSRRGTQKVNRQQANRRTTRQNPDGSIDYIEEQLITEESFTEWEN